MACLAGGQYGGCRSYVVVTDKICPVSACAAAAEHAPVDAHSVMSGTTLLATHAVTYAFMAAAWAGCKFWVMHTCKHQVRPLKLEQSEVTISYFVPESLYLSTSRLQEERQARWYVE